MIPSELQCLLFNYAIIKIMDYSKMAAKILNCHIFLENTQYFVIVEISMSV